jgi:tRNA(Ile)-lysidine synthase
MAHASTESSLLAAVHAAIEKQHLFPDRGVVVVGVSGGSDSVCLLYVLKNLCKPAGPYAHIGIHVAHLEHGLRGDAGRADAAFVADLAVQWNLPCTLGQEDVPNLARMSHRSIEDAARQARYAFLRRVAATVGAERVAVAHQADDQVETLVMHWLRGSGLAGLAGMQPLEGDIIRPLLSVSRAEVLRYCEQQQLAYRVDASNQDRRFLRNRVRHDLLPVLEQYNPNLRATLLRNAAVLAEEDTYMQAQVDARWPEVVVSRTARSLEGDVLAYRRLPLALRRLVLLRAGWQTSDGEVHLELRHLEAIDALLLGASGSGALHLPGRLRLYRVYERFTLERSAGRGQPGNTSGAFALRPEDVSLAVPGEAHLPGTHWLVRAHVLDRQNDLPPGYEQRGSREQWGYIDLDVLEAYQPLHVRTRRAGDRFRGLGMQAAKKLQDVLVDAKVPRDERDALPLVCGADGSILWVAGYRIADVLKLTKATRRVLALELEAVS